MRALRVSTRVWAATWFVVGVLLGLALVSLGWV